MGVMYPRPDRPDKQSKFVPSSSKGSILMIENLRQFGASGEAGQTMAEYAVVLGVITIAIVVTLGLLSTAVQNLLTNVISIV
jgi:Flp pilus assembly pilin Flp